MMGTIYAWPADTAITKHDMFTGANRAITAIVASLAFGACVGCAVFFIIESIRARRERQRRRRVVVASILMDPNDRILVNSTDGLPPMCDIASLSTSDVPSPRKSLDQSLNSGSTILGMDLTSGHEAFVSALKLSWYWRNPRWNVVNPLGAPSTGSLPPIASVSNSIAEIRRGSLNTTTSTVMSRPARISVAKFLERFVVSAGQLAVRLTGQQDGISRIGVLYDQILTTGWVKLRDNSNDTVSKGQLIFLVRRVTSPDERTDLLARHFIWADGLAVAASLTKTLSVPAEHLIPLLMSGCFAIRPSAPRSSPPRFMPAWRSYKPRRLTGCESCSSRTIEVRCRCGSSARSPLRAWFRPLRTPLWARSKRSVKP
jgi:hypothetical protein